MINSLSCVVDMTSSAPTVTRVIPEDTPVTGVTSLGDDVFVVRFDSPQVEVYDAVTFTLQRRLPVPGRGGPCGLAACASNKCLYASDYHNDLIHRVELTGSNAVTRWSVGSGPVGLTVNSDKNVLVVIEGERMLQKVTTHGTQLRTIQLQADIELPSLASYPAVQWPVCDQPHGRHPSRVLSGRQRSSCSKLWRHSGLWCDEDE